MSNFQNSLTTPGGLPGAASPNQSLNNVNSANSIMNNGPLGSPILMAANSSPIVVRNQLPVSSQPEQIIVPVGNVMSAGKTLDSSTRQPSVNPQTATSSNSSQGATGSGVLDKARLRDLVKEVDPLEQMDDDVEDVLLQVADDFIENVVAASCQLAKHRRSNTLEAKDVQLYLERSWNMQVPGFGSEELRPYKKSITTEAHKQRMALIRKTLKKY
ncbi:Transcription initiation factor TFIID subunit 12 [Bulinus truncatus]|nr:Transcription initiation factor TFIID subunit 12 [Bulinus truncatus]